MGVLKDTYSQRDLTEALNNATERLSKGTWQERRILVSPKTAEQIKKAYTPETWSEEFDYDLSGASREVKKKYEVVWTCRGCRQRFNDATGNYHLALCFDCSWECPRCDGIDLKPDHDYICEKCRYG